MRGARTALVVVLLLGVAGSAAAGQMTLTRSGDLYRVAAGDDALVVNIRSADGATSQLMIPQTTAVAADSLQVGVDETTGALFVLWQEDAGMDASIRLATYVDGTWLGPTTIAGGDGTAAFNPQLLLQRKVSMITEEAEEGEEPVVTKLATTFLHLVWWSQISEEDSGSAFYLAAPLGADGTPQLDGPGPSVVSDLLPYGIGCFDLEDTDSLKHPKLFVDPASGLPHVFATDFANCLFQIIELRPEVVEEALDDGAGKRRRHVVVLRTGAMIGLRPDLPLASAKIEVGENLSLIMYWDGGEEGLLQFLELDQETISETKSLVLGEELSHEQAVELIRGLTR